MVSQRYVELKKKTSSELEKELATTKLELIKISAQLSTGAAAKEAGKLRTLKKKVARIKTLQTAQERK